MGSNPAPRTREDLTAIFHVLLHLKKQGFRESTIKAMGRKLRSLRVSLRDPEAVKEYVANLDCSEGHKGNLINAYAHYCQFYTIQFEKPYYQRIDRIHRVAKTEDINKVIACASLRYATAFSILRATGMRPVELCWLQLKQIDMTTGQIYPATAKKGSARVLQMKPSTLAMLKRYLSSKDQRLWPSRKRLTEALGRARTRAALKLQEPDLLTIRLYDLRHTYATLLYCRTKDILHVQRMLGHKNIMNTLRYTHCVDIDAERYIVKASKTVETSTDLLESGYEYVGPMHGVHVFRKPKPPLFFYLVGER